MNFNHVAVAIGVVLVVILLTMSAISIVGAYVIVDDPAWTLRFDKLGEVDEPARGWAVRAGLAALIVLAGFTAVFLGFGDEFEELVVPWSELKPLEEAAASTEGQGRWRIAFRLVFLFLAIGWGGWEASRLFDQSERGPAAELVAWGERHDAYREHSWSAAGQWESAQRAYRWFLPYSLAIYAIVVPLVVVIPSYAAITRDLRSMSAANARLAQAIAAGREPAEVCDKFIKFKNEWYKKCLRYLNLGAAVALVLVYYQLIGKHAFSRPFQQTTFMTFAVIGMNGAFFVFVWYVYHDAWINTLTHLESHQQRLKTEDEPWKFLGRLFLQSFSGYLVLIVLLIPLKNMLSISG
jgi:hypothetical protein